jgi:hypothetical protein
VWAQIVNTALGVWLMFAPAVLGHSGTTLANLDRAVGPTVAAASFVAVAQITRSVRWLTLPAAAVLAVVPWFLDAPTASRVNSVAIAVVMLVLAPLGRPDQRRYGNGWTSLWRDEDLPGWDARRGDEATGART